MANEIHSEDIKPRQRKSVDLSQPLDAIRSAEAVELVTEMPSQDALQFDRFMNEDLTIRLEQSSDRFAPTTIDISVNGETKWLKVGMPIQVKRKFVEVLARCRSDVFFTRHNEIVDGDPINRLQRSTFTKYPFSVIEDRNPQGSAWLTSILSQS